MSQWKTDDSAANSVLWGPSQLKQTANAANRNALFGNTTADAYVTGTTIGAYGVADNEMNYDTWKILGIVPGSNTGTGVLITSNSTTQFIANGTGATNAVANVVSIRVHSATINAAGQGYVNGDIVAIDGGNGTAAQFTVTANATGNVTAVSVYRYGYYADSANVPGAAETTTAITGSGNSLVLDVLYGADSFSLAVNGSYTVAPDTTDFLLTPEAGQSAAANVLVNLTITKFNAKQSVAHAGHVLVTQGTGGRAGRIQCETLVTQSALSGDAEDTLFANNA